MQSPHSLCLIILDGFGIRSEKDHNAIYHANTPFWDTLWKTYPHTTLQASGSAVGLPEGQMGNSEVGHLTLGAGRVIEQDLNRLSKQMQPDLLQHNEVLKAAIQKAKNTGASFHILGLLSPGGVHSHESQIFDLLKYLKNFPEIPVVVHAFLDGRDTPPKSAKSSLEKLSRICNEQIHLGSLSGRYYAMDRDKRFDRIEKVYELLTQNKTNFQAKTALEALDAAYQRNETDEFVSPTRINETPFIKDNDMVIFMNFRADRARQLTHAFCDQPFSGFKRSRVPQLGGFLTLTEYEKNLPVQVLFPPQPVKNTVGELLEQAQFKQLRIAETEKYAHVTFFFNGGREILFEGEDRVLVPSPKVATYDVCPEMSAVQLTEQLLPLIQQKKYDVIILNFANADMLGHTGNFEATVKSIETLDRCLEKIITALQMVGAEAIITADHGNAECMYDHAHQQPHTAHTTEAVPFIYVGRKATMTHDRGTLADIAPTLLYLLSLPIPKNMTGKSLVQLC